jgi:hypothetical protein
MRLLAVAVAALSASACDTLIAHRMVVRAPPDQEPAVTTAEMMGIAHEALRSCGVKEEHVSSDRHTWLWSDPERRPGLVIDIRPGPEVNLSQNLYGPIGQTRTYRCVKAGLQARLAEQYGKDSVRMK